MRIALPRLLLSLLVLLLAVGRVEAQSEIFSVSRIEVDRTADSAAAAREAALADGHRLALRRLFEKLVPAADYGALPDLPLSQIYPLVTDFAVTNERSSDVRYLAELTFRFRGDEVRALLRRSKLAFAATPSQPVLIVPVYGAAGEARLWENNPWYDSWAVRPLDRGLVPLLIPLGDLGDVALVDARAAMEADEPRLQALAERYDTEGLLVSHAVLEGDPEAGTASLTLATFQLVNLDQAPFEQSFVQQPGEDLTALLARAADALDAVVQEEWKLGNLLQVDADRSIEVQVVTSNLQDWLEIERRLRGVASIDSIRLKSLSRAGSEVEIGFVGNEQQLSMALGRRDLVLSLNADSAWELYWREGSAPGGEQAPQGATDEGDGDSSTSAISGDEPTEAPSAEGTGAE